VIYLCVLLIKGSIEWSTSSCSLFLR
jgi:hypothetical protein